MWPHKNDFLVKLTLLFCLSQSSSLLSGSMRKVFNHIHARKLSSFFPSSRVSLKNLSELPSIDSKCSIILSADEVELVSLLSSVADEFSLKTTIRIAGGWVRDRMLELPIKDDIDVVLDDMTGSQFTQYIEKWNAKHGFQQVKFAVIQQNPEKSKHLETGMRNRSVLHDDS